MPALLDALALLLALAAAAPGDIYRCRDAAGQVSFQDRPCVGAESARLATGGEDSAASRMALQQWLDAERRRPSPPPSRGVSVGGAVSPGPRRIGVAGSGVTQGQLAMCSERFLDCARGNAAAMDACIATLPRCGAVASDCCPEACIGRYRSLRSEGQGLASAVRLALLDPDAPACSALQESE